MRQKEQASPTNVGPIEVQIDQRDSEEGQPAGQRSCQTQWWTPTWGLVAGLWFLRSYSNWWDMTRQAPWFYSFVPGDVEGVSECQQLLAAAHFWCQLTTIYNCPFPALTHTETHSRAGKGHIQVYCALEKQERKKQVVFSFLFNLSTWIKHDCIESICCLHEAKSANSLKTNT